MELGFGKRRDESHMPIVIYNDVQYHMCSQSLGAGEQARVDFWARDAHLRNLFPTFISSVLVRSHEGFPTVLLSPRRQSALYYRLVLRRSAEFDEITVDIRLRYSSLQAA